LYVIDAADGAFGAPGIVDADGDAPSAGDAADDDAPPLATGPLLAMPRWR